MKKRLLTSLLACLMVALMFTGCGKPKLVNGGKEVTITYANWNLGTEEENNIERRMIQAYMDKNPHVTIKIAENIDNSKYGDSMIAAAAAGELPDAFMLQNIPTALTNEWLMDISELNKKDKEWAKMAKPVIESTKYGKGIYAIPAGQFFMGYYVNKDLFEKENLDAPEFGFTAEEFEKAVKDLNMPNKGVLGLAEEEQIVEWYPITNNLGYFSWDGSKFNLTDNSFKEGINKAKEYFKSGLAFTGLSAEQKEKFNGKEPWEAWPQGEIGLKWDGTWIGNDWKEFNFDWEFIGLPGGKTVIVNDYIGISKSSENAEVAYDFVKWMTFSKEGFLKRIEIAKENDFLYASLPLINDKDLIEAYFAYRDVPGLKEAFENMDKGVVEPVKTVPGYVQARWEGLTGVKVDDNDNVNMWGLIFNSFRGDLKFEDYASQANDLANAKYKEAADTIKALTDK